MKAIASVLTLFLMMNSQTWAKDVNQAKIKTIKAMYQQDIKAQNGIATLTQFSGGGLQKALKKQQKFGERSGELCGFDYDILWQSQDPDYGINIQYATAPNGHIKVNLGHEGSVAYVLACEGQSCKITDVISGGSVVKMINQACK